MSDHQISIRLVEDRIAFHYTITIHGEPLEYGTINTDEVVPPGYYGGSETMD